MYLFAWIAACVFVAEPAPPYDGKYGNDPAFKKAIATIPALRSAALADIDRELGLIAPKGVVIRVEVVDARPSLFDVVRRFDEAPFQTRGSGDSAQDPIVIRLYSEFMVNGRLDWRTSLKHELVHAVMRAAMPDAAHDALPPWFREGLALHIAGQTESRLAAQLRDEDVLHHPSKLCPGLERGEHRLERYAEDALAFEHLATAHGADAPGRLARAVCSGMALHEALEQVTGASFDAFRETARVFSIARANAAVPREATEYLAIAAADHIAARAEVCTLAVKFERAYPRSSLLPDVLYWHGKACRIDGDGAEARPLLEQLAHELASGADYADEALYQLAAAAIDDKKFHDALALLDRDLRDHPDGGGQDRVVQRIAVCHAALKDKKEALRWIGVFERSFENSKVAADVRKLKESLGG